MVRFAAAGFAIERRSTAALAGLSLAGLALPALAILDPPRLGRLLPALAGVVVAAAVAALVRRGRLGGPVVLLALPLAALAAWLLTQTSYPPSAWLLGLLAGCAVGLALPAALSPLGSRLWLSAALALAALLLVDWLAGSTLALGLAAVAPAPSTLARLAWEWPRPRLAARRLTGFLVGVSLAALLLTSWIGANTASATWFGTLVSHGPRQGSLVALTFDDGPDDPYTLRIRDLLDAYGVKATFFTVGKALAARPDISRALYQDGQLLGDHSYHHDNVSWLDPRYPELSETQQAFQRELGICPAFFRPPHGQHTPFMSAALQRDGMTMITWDVSAGDWATSDGRLVSQRVLAKVRPGSIILLHDGIDGTVDADRSVILTALPLILDGLRQRGLQPVTLDRLLGRPGYLDHC